MPKYLVEAPHDELNCELIVGQVYAMGFLHNFDWGCESGVHCGWAMIDADSENDAKLVVPSVARPDARAIRLVKFRPEDAHRLHSSGPPGQPEGN
jgi:hypothetical protein